MIFLGFQVPQQCCREELNHPVSPAVPPLVHKQQDELSPSGETLTDPLLPYLLCLSLWGQQEPRARCPG